MSARLRSTPLVAAVLAALLAACAQTPPAQLPTQAGVLLAQHNLPVDLGLKDAGRQLEVRYTSTDGNTGLGQRVTSGAVFYPKGTPPAGGWPVVAWAHGTVGVGDACAPSRTPRSARDADYLGAWLREGFVVVATDYQGLGTDGPHLYLHARAQAYSMLDAVRAALSLPNVSNRVVLVGQSQGGGAVFATAGHATAYAPELKILGTVATGTPHISRRSASMFPDDRVNPTLAYSMYAAQSAQVLDPSLTDTELFTDKALPVYRQSATLCIGPLTQAVVGAGLTTANTFQPGAAAKVAQRLAPGLAYPTLSLPQPIFMGIGEKDVSVSAEQQVALAADACKAGTKVVHKVYPGLDHGGTVGGSLPDSVPFVRALLAGTPVVSTCP